jgi:hypothetical protein
MKPADIGSHRKAGPFSERSRLPWKPEPKDHLEEALDDTAQHRVVVSLQTAPATRWAEKIRSEIKARYTSAPSA